IAAFFGIIVRTYFAGLQINCGCFGPGAEPLTGWTILRDGLFLALAAGVTIAAFLRARRPGRAGARGASSAGAAPANP
ncbi:MAG TPA: MauE/DoxX family redox-associated membrane protein, partial [Candidatus Dormibacteraeota bacterium]|nr:MauE/DoxX family redox-associated membrane protein [Candidatus Dormibacteraeota bacterium]